MKTCNILHTLALVCLLLSATNIIAQNKYRWTDELALLRSIDRLPEYRSGCHVEQFSSYDRTWGNDDGFSGKYSYLRKEGGKLVIAEMKGAGVINRIWTPTPNDNILCFYFDGKKEPGLRIRFSDLFSGKVFPFVKPVCGNEVGGYYCYLPITYAKSCKIVMEGDGLQFIQIQYRQLPGTKVETYDGTFTDADKALLNDVCNTWAATSPQANTYALGRSAGATVSEKTITLKPGDEVTCFESNVPGRITGIEIDGGTAFEGPNKNIILSARWDDDKTEAICAPVADFFGYAYGRPAMRSILMGRSGYTNYCYLPMPYDKSAQLKLIYRRTEGTQQPPVSVRVKIHHNTTARDAKTEGKFYSSWRRTRTPLGEYHTFLNTKGKGHYVGTILLAQGLRSGMTTFFEGDDSTYVDGRMRMHGTGSEDYFNGGWYALLDRWDRGHSMPIHGCLDYSLQMSRTGGYRFFISDKLTFDKEIFHGIEHGDVNNCYPVDYTSLAFYYSDTAPDSIIQPVGNLLKEYRPDRHTFYPQLMEITPDGDIQINNDRGLRISTGSSGNMRIMLNDIPEGRYKLYMSYHETSAGTRFQIWQRQKLITDWRESHNDTDTYREDVYMGEIELTSQDNSITVHITKDDKGNSLIVGTVTLERIPDKE